MWVSYIHILSNIFYEKMDLRLFYFHVTIYKTYFARSNKPQYSELQRITYSFRIVVLGGFALLDSHGKISDYM